MSKNGTQATPGARVDWVDYAKGICIIMVVMMHSTLGVEAAAGDEGFMHLIVAFAKPFRMPDFFLISGLFLPLVINRNWRTYLDRKVVHFFYFYILWTAIQFAFKAPHFASTGGWMHVGAMYLESFIEPFGTLWFIYLLPVFFVVTKLTLRLPGWAVWIAAALLEASHLQTGWTAIDEFAARFVYFYSGYLFSRHIFALAEAVRARPGVALAGLAMWAIINATLVHIGASEWPLVSLALGIAGACAVIAAATLLARAKLIDAIRYCGEHSIVIYLAFFLPMAATRTLLMKTSLIADVGLISLIVTTAGVVGSLLIWWAVRDTRLNFLFERPGAFWIAPQKPHPVLQPAE
ncbi:acyltransferase family protein [Afipia carboxidovorans]|uniref:acyltransferase family protein n=1 Tax=Afipia carboxidovorans TaxID=40137 RepID=UPI003086974D|nr:acyltransferase family protein [Afipia carboxidovorans]